MLARPQPSHSTPLCTAPQAPQHTSCCRLPYACVASPAPLNPTPPAPTPTPTPAAGSPPFRSLHLTFLEPKELEEDTLSPLTSLTSLTSLTLVNITVTEASHLAPLAQLPALTSLDLIQHNKVAALLSGDACLEQLSKLTQLTRLVLKGRISGLGDAGVLALKQLTGLTHLAISWVPGQTPVTQVSWGEGQGVVVLSLVCVSE